MGTDAPDYQRVVTTVSGGSVTDAPDWQRTVTGPGATPVGGGGGVITGATPPKCLAMSITSQASYDDQPLGPGNLWLAPVVAGASSSTASVAVLLEGAGIGETKANQWAVIYSVDEATAELNLIGSVGGISFETGSYAVPSWFVFPMSSAVTITAGESYVIGVVADCATANPGTVGTNNPTSVSHGGGPSGRWPSSFYLPSITTPPSTITLAQATAHGNTTVFLFALTE